MNTVYLKGAVTKDFLSAAEKPFYIRFKVRKCLGFDHQRVAGEKLRGKISKNSGNDKVRAEMCSPRCGKLIVHGGRHHKPLAEAAPCLSPTRIHIQHSCTAAGG